MSDNVDIYFVLLGLPAGRRPPDHYTLLGLPPLTDSQRQINAAVERQMAKLTPLLLGRQGRRAQRMIGEVLQARDVLSSQRRKRAYDAELVGACIEPDANAETRELDVPKDAGPADLASPPACEAMAPSIAPPIAPPIQLSGTPPTVVASQSPFVAPPSPFVAPPNPFISAPECRLAPRSKDISLSEMALNILQPRVEDDELVDDPVEEDRPATIAAPLPRPMIASLAMSDAEIIPAANPLSDFTSYDRQIDAQLPTPASAAQSDWPRASGGSGAAGVSRGVPFVSPTRQNGSQGLLTVIAAVVAGVALVACVGLIANQRHNAQISEASKTAKTNPTGAHSPADRGSAPPQSSPGRKRNPTAAPKATKEPAQRPSVPKSTPAMETPASSPQPERDPPKSSAPTEAPPVKPAPSAPTPATPEPEPKPNPPTPADPKAAKAVAEALTAARTALGKRDVDEAGKALDLAMVEASSAELVAKIEGEKTLHHYVEGFWGAVRDRIGGLQGGEELAVGKQVINIVEKRGDRIIIRDRGTNKTYGLRDMPAPLAAALAQSWLKKDDPNSAVFVGAFWSVDAKGDAKRGRQILEDAKKNGAEAAAGVLEALGPAK